MKDPNETVHTYDYDRLGRITQDRVTALGTDLDDGILRIETRYDTKRLRHSCATRMHGNGADIRFIQILLGHGSLETTQIYTEVSIEKLREVHARTHPHGGKQKGHQS